MAYLKPKNIHGQTYWYIAESRRVAGRVKTITLAYLGKADDVLKRLQSPDMTADHLKSFEHGAVAVLLSLADRLELVRLIDRYPEPPAHGQPARQLLSVGQTLLLAALGRALHPTSKAGWADWAKKTTLGKLWGFDPTRISSQFFWDQMDRLPREALPAVQAELARRVLDRFGVSGESLFYDVTNFHTFIDSRNDHCDLPQRGKNKQKRNDLRQFQVGMLVSRDGWVPLLARLYRGNHNDVTTSRPRWRPSGSSANSWACRSGRSRWSPTRATSRRRTGSFWMLPRSGTWSRWFPASTGIGHIVRPASSRPARSRKWDRWRSFGAGARSPAESGRWWS